jgi:CRISPR/Cas system-associated endonuclease Cas1
MLKQEFANMKRTEIAKEQKSQKQFIIGKIEAQTQILRKHGLGSFESLELPSIDQIERLYAENVESIRLKLQTIESHYTKHYFSQIFKLLARRFVPKLGIEVRW